MGKATEILIVDDDRMSLVLLQRQLMELGYETEGMTSGPEALKLLDAAPDRFDLIVLDRLIPDLDGIEMTREIKRRPTVAHLPIVMVTGAGSSAEMQEGLDAGVFYYLAKPVSKGLVQSVIGSAVRQQNLSATLTNRADGTEAFTLVEGAKFGFRTPAEAEILAGFVANIFPDPQRTVMGAAALMLNAVEHGICGIGYDAKGQLLHDGDLDDEIENRLADRPDARAHAVVAVKPDGIYLSITDPGPGFNWKDYLSLDMSRNAAAHGRGIVRAKAEAFDKLVFRGSGNTVVGFTGHDSQIEW